MIPEWALPEMVELLMRAECELKLARLSKTREELAARLYGADHHVQKIRELLGVPR
ncbi:Uncharacterised protein [Mycobacteroides abscessus subsp. massiliense]|uniref:hypothetical protein n=1 Tax=Mycobacteroides abscessus TaxID=36809 RepID=UPI0009D34776|nr:hypothetical protein [Mycobacteroides abscessus]SKM81790.1 Uncharacterised protein [Mycobacteroides abscessus subsp. massiliense]SKM98466.1 Uncharacterised protein [Mycobacteroides abscessus subsp. massiliense]SKN77129.1 Uncharacterised protein [Mycobacteroides abscessus subsp. massiliense]SKN96006.1 Uncharacterised protein [Mycobacteroides abscessus subsp. massiliense]SKO22427.1 Uncharacterised protein [Mycobacteroides abscessus subsp. massiliense]